MKTVIAATSIWFPYTFSLVIHINKYRTYIINIVLFAGTQLARMCVSQDYHTAVKRLTT
jgi:hypothetical protein